VVQKSIVPAGARAGSSCVYMASRCSMYCASVIGAYPDEAPLLTPLALGQQLLAPTSCAPIPMDDVPFLATESQAEATTTGGGHSPAGATEVTPLWIRARVGNRRIWAQ
jgi:hypothetical protein